MAPHEPEVRFFSPMPHGYVFVPKGDVYMTKNCRQRTHTQGQKVYVVIDKHNRPIGLRCPEKIFAAVQADHNATASKRANAVERRDAAIYDKFEEAVERLFPRIPPDAVPKIISHAVKKRSGRVGRTETVDLDDKAKLAVWAHIRHCHTNYEQLLRAGEERLEARSMIGGTVNSISMKWGGPPTIRPRKGYVKKATAKQSARRGRARHAAAASGPTQRRARQSGVPKKEVATHPGPRVQTRQMSRPSAGLPNSADNPIEILDSEDNNFSVSEEDSGSDTRGGEPDSDDEDFSVSDEDSDDLSSGGWSDTD